MTFFGMEFGPLQAFGLLGNVAFTSRFFVQWIASERAKKSVVPEAFWWLSIIGSAILLVYFIAKREPIGIIGYLPNLIPYTRNLILVYRHKNTPAGEGQA